MSIFSGFLTQHWRIDVFSDKLLGLVVGSLAQKRSTRLATEIALLEAKKIWVEPLVYLQRRVFL